MGSEQSSSSTHQSEQKGISKHEMDRLLQQQKALFEQKYAELMRTAREQQQNTYAAQQIAKEEARKEVERIMKEKQEQLSRQNCQLNDNLLKSTAPQASSSSRSPNVATASNCTPKPLYPDLNSARPTRPIPTVTDKSAPILPAPVQPSRSTPSLPDRSAQTLQSASATSVPDRNTVRPTNYNNVPPPPQYNNLSPSSSTSSGSYVYVNQKYNQPSVLPPQPRPLIPASAPPQPRDRSISRSRNRNSPKEDDDLNCPTCKSRYDGNIYQCSRGHSSCRHCKLGYRVCGAWVSRKVGVCNLPISDMRNITLEAYIGERKVHCPYSEKGCCLYIKLADIEGHAKECPFREMQCPLASIFGQCSWSGKLSQMAQHFDCVHQMHRQADIDSEMVLLNLTNDYQNVYLIVIGTFNFLFHAKVSEVDQKLYMAVQLIGTHHSAAKWTYEVHIYNKRQPRRKYVYTDICSAMNSSIGNTFTNSECAAIPLAYVNTFMNEGILTYKFFIKKEDVSNQIPNRGKGGVRRRGGSANRENSRLSTYQ